MHVVWSTLKHAGAVAGQFYQGLSITRVIVSITFHLSRYVLHYLHFACLSYLTSRSIRLSCHILPAFLAGRHRLRRKLDVAG